DHIHILISAKPHISLSDLAKDMKSSSSKWINEKGFVRGKFLWQEGFGAFSYSQSGLPDVIAYIENQEFHHAKKAFRQEYIEMLQAFKVEYDEKYIFEEVGN
ncbi:MAG TPA: transposase, partial [Bacteroidia bacterium]|nr:transposase [Bacteroidia bacterium]